MSSTERGSDLAKRDAMAALAAKLMARGAQTQPSAASQATMPRTVPTPQPSDLMTRAQPPTQSNTSPTMSAPKIKPEPSSPAALPAFAASQGHGPSLRYSADQLTAAREFMSTATPGGQKSRGGSRARVLSQEPSRVREPATHAHPRSPASSNRSTAYAPAVASPRERPSTTKPAATSSHISGLEQWQALRGAPQSDRTLPAKVVSASQENPKQSSSPAAGNSGIKAQYPLPPIDPATAPVPTAKPISPTVKENVAPPTPAASNDVNGKAKPVTSLFAMSTSHQVAGILKNVGTKTQEASNSITGTIPKSSVEGTKAEDKATSATALAARTPLEEVKEESINGQASSSNSMFAEPRDEIAALNKRIVALEAESFNLQKQVETLLQGNERRKFLGTDSASTPFALEVKDAAGASLTIQVAADLKAGDLIRRIRTKADIAPVNSKDPRVIFNGQQLGHGMMLGEAGITQGCAVVFTYGGQ